MHRSRAFCYGCVPLLVESALLLRWSLWSVLGPELPFLFLWPVVMLCAWLGDFGPGVLATGLSLAAADFFLLEPHFAFGPKTPAEWCRMGLFLVLGVALSSVVELFRRARRRVEAYAHEAAHQREWLRVMLTSIRPAAGDGAARRPPRPS